MKKYAENLSIGENLFLRYQIFVNWVSRDSKKCIDKYLRKNKNYIDKKVSRG